MEWRLCAEQTVIPLSVAIAKLTIPYSAPLGTDLDCARRNCSTTTYNGD